MNGEEGYWYVVSIQCGILQPLPQLVNDTCVKVGGEVSLAFIGGIKCPQFQAKQNLLNQSTVNPSRPAALEPFILVKSALELLKRYFAFYYIVFLLSQDLFVEVF